MICIVDLASASKIARITVCVFDNDVILLTLIKAGEVIQTSKVLYLHQTGVVLQEEARNLAVEIEMQEVDVYHFERWAVYWWHKFLAADEGLELSLVQDPVLIQVKRLLWLWLTKLLLFTVGSYEWAL